MHLHRTLLAESRTQCASVFNVEMLSVTLSSSANWCNYFYLMLFFLKSENRLCIGCLVIVLFYVAGRRRSAFCRP